MLALISGVVMAVIGQIFARGALKLMGTPEDVIDKSTLYMRIYFLGMPFFMMYNYGAAILRAVGDTKRPLLFLIVSGIIQCIVKHDFCYCFSYECGGSSYCDSDFSDTVLYAGITLSASYRRLLSAPGLQTEDKELLPETDFPGGNTGGNSEYCH